MKKILRHIKKIARIQKEPIYIANEAIVFEKQCIFIAIPKTGTTSIRNQLKQEGTPIIKAPHLNIMQIRDLLYVYFLKMAVGKNKTFPTNAAIFDDKALRKKSSQTFNTFFKFASVRNPWARAVSLFFRQDAQYAGRREKNMTFEKFCDQHIYASDTCTFPTLHKNQIDWLCDENGQIIMDYVFKLEDMEIAIPEIKQRTDGRVVLRNRKDNKNPHSPADNYQNIYSEKSKKIIATRFAKDIDHFKYIF